MRNIKYKNEKKDPNEINKYPCLNKEFNDRIRKLTTENTTYTDFNENIPDSVKQISLTNKYKNKGWFNYSRSTLEDILKKRPFNSLN